MPIEVGIWRITNGLERVQFAPIETEHKLEDILAEDITILDPSLMLVGRQIPTAYGTFIDLLAVDAQGDLHVIELKRNRTPREVVAQALDYASWVQGLTYEQIIALYAERHAGRAFEQAFADRFGGSPPESLNQNHRLIVVAGYLDNSTERIINYLSTGFGVPINAVFFRYFKDGANQYLTRTWLMEPDQAEAQAAKVKGPAGAGQQTWNGRDWYVALGVGEHRAWEDCLKYGFVSAGQGPWYSNTLKLLPVGARIFVHIPKTGYVGVGIVKEPAVRVRDFMVEVDGAQKPILEAPLTAPQMDENADDPEQSEYLVRVEWIKTVPEKHAYWEKGMFANQNSACKLRNSFTLERLAKHFELDQDGSSNQGV